MASAYALPHRPMSGARPTPAGMRLTRRGWLLLVGVPLVATLTLLPLRAAASGHPGSATPGWVMVTVSQGDTLWEYAEAAAPGSDPRPLVAQIREANGLVGSTLQPGQELLVPAPSNP